MLLSVLCTLLVFFNLFLINFHGFGRSVLNKSITFVMKNKEL